jgi:hypothetical protein
MTIDRIAPHELEGAWQTLRERWLELGTVWNDPVYERFGRDHWVPLETQMLATREALVDLARVVAQAHRSVK